MGATTPTGPRPSTGRWWLRAPLLLVVLAAALRLWMPGPPIFTVDELSWTARSERFATALADLDLASANAAPDGVEATRPGVTTMWIGVLGDQAADADLLDADELRWTHALMGLVCSLLLWPFIVVAARLVGRRAAVVAGGLLAVEPLLVGHSAIQHTDALVTMTYGLAAVALIAAFEARRAASAVDAVGSAQRWASEASARLAILGGAAAALGCLTKVSIVPLLGALVATLLVLHWRAAAVLVPTMIAFAVVFVVLWPALWVDPVANVTATIGTGELASSPSEHLLLGEVIEGSDWRFYPVELWYRASPWLLVGGVLALGWAVWRGLRRWEPLLFRRTTLALAVPAVVYLAVIALSDKQYGRYLLPLLPLAALGLGVTAAALFGRIDEGHRLRAAGWTGLALAALYTASLAPYAVAHSDPLVGGQRAAEDAIQLGWGEGREVVIEAFLDRAGEGCPSWSGVGPWLIQCPAQDLSWLDGQGDPPRYVLTYVADRQLGAEPPGLRAYLADHGELVRRARIDGVDYAELWELDGG